MDVCIFKRWCDKEGRNLITSQETPQEGQVRRLTKVESHNDGARQGLVW